MDAAAADALVERLFAASLGGKELLTVELGRRTGMYSALAAGGPATFVEVAQAAGVAERYSREFLEQQVAAGFIECLEPGADPDERRYVLPEAHAAVLLDEDDPRHVAPLADAMAGLGTRLDDVVSAYQQGHGVPFHAYGRSIRHGLAQLNRAVFVNELADDWLPHLGDLHERLTNGGGTVVDLGCGSGSSTVALAHAYPKATVHGIDLDPASIEEARSRAVDEGVDDRTAFAVDDAAAADLPKPADLVTAFEMLHDTGDPLGVLRNAAGSLAPNGALLLADERVADEFGPDADEVERFQFAWSVLHCLPATMAESPVHAHGTILRRPTVFAWADEAEFGGAAELPIENDFWRFYRLDPAA